MRVIRQDRIQGRPEVPVTPPRMRSLSPVGLHGEHRDCAFRRHAVVQRALGREQDGYVVQLNRLGALDRFAQGLGGAVVHARRARGVRFPVHDQRRGRRFRG